MSILPSDNRIVAAFFIFCAIVLALSLRGLAGNPTPEMLITDQWRDDGPLELSPERGRFGLTYSIAEDRSLHFSTPIARFILPDLGINKKGQFVSLFAPGVSFLVIPGYVIGKFFNLAQVGTFSVVSLFALANAILIWLIAVRLGANRIAALLGALIFLFATPAFAYGVTLYQHHFSTFCILLALYALIRWEGLRPLPLVWFLCGASIVIDNPNFFFMLPVAWLALGRVFNAEYAGGLIRSKFRPIALVTIATIIVPVGLFLWFNYASHGVPLQFSGTLPAVKAIDAQGKPSNPDKAIVVIDGEVQSQNKTATGGFKTRNLMNGFYIHFISPDRGILLYAPVILLGFWGLFFLYRRNRVIGNVLAGTIGFIILLYSMWGDPWGGWAFGSRYLIPTYAVLAIGLAFLLSHWKKKRIWLLIFFILASYSLWVNALGALTSNRMPPQVEILALEAISHRQEKYSYDRDLDYIRGGRSKSFVYQEYLYDVMTAEEYHRMIVGLLVAVLGVLVVKLTLEKKRLTI